MGKTYRPYVPEQDLLLPPSLRDWLPENHLAYFVSEVIDQLDLSVIESHYEREERGYPPYHPRMMTKLLVYGYWVGVYSSRRLERRVVEDVAFRVLAAGNEPDFRTISDLRRIHLQALRGLFDQVAAAKYPLQAPTPSSPVCPELAPEPALPPVSRRYSDELLDAKIHLN
jgi:transposase